LLKNSKSEKSRKVRANKVFGKKICLRIANLKRVEKCEQIKSCWKKDLDKIGSGKEIKESIRECKSVCKKVSQNSCLLQNRTKKNCKKAAAFIRLIRLTLHGSVFLLKQASDRSHQSQESDTIHQTHSPPEVSSESSGATALNTLPRRKSVWANQHDTASRGGGPPPGHPEMAM
jgi:hypothetical protein